MKTPRNTSGPPRLVGLTSHPFSHEVDSAQSISERARDVGFDMRELPESLRRFAEGPASFDLTVDELRWLADAPMGEARMTVTDYEALVRLLRGR